MIKNTITLKMGKFPPQTVAGYSHDNDTALIVHRDPTGCGWNIGHKSGWGILSHIRTRSAALKAAEQLGALANWHNITPDNALDWYNANKKAFLEIKAEASLA